VAIQAPALQFVPLSSYLLRGKGSRVSTLFVNRTENKTNVSIRVTFLLLQVARCVKVKRRGVVAVWLSRMTDEAFDYGSAEDAVSVRAP
jgi:hypothetical protein